MATKDLHLLCPVCREGRVQIVNANPGYVWVCPQGCKSDVPVGLPDQARAKCFDPAALLAGEVNEVEVYRAAVQLCIRKLDKRTGAIDYSDLGREDEEQMKRAVSRALHLRAVLKRELENKE